MEDGIFWKGKKLSEHSKEELIKIIEHLHLKNKQILKEKKHERNFLMSLRKSK